MFHVTNQFACLDVALTKGTNYIGVQAVDWAGNVFTTNFNYVFDTNGDITPPAIALIWPQDGMEISGSSFTLRGILDDDTAAVSGQYADANGTTTIVNGLVERGGRFWLQSLPLQSGTNVVTVTATDVAGNRATTNLTLVKSSVSLTMNSVDSSQLNQVMVNVKGNISDPAFAVWINGVQGTNNGDGTWSANNVPVTSGGTASFDLTAYPPAYVPTDNSWTNFAVELEAYPNPFPADPSQASVSEDKPSVVYVQQAALGYNNYLAWNPQHPEATAASQGWSQGGGGSHSTTWSGQVYGINESSSATINWPKDAGLVPTLPGHYHCDIYTNGSLQRVYDGYGKPTPFTFFFDLPLETFSHLVGSGQYPTNANGWAVPPTWSESAQYVVALFTGGKPERQGKSLFILSQSLDWSTGDDYDYGQYDQSGSVTPTAITLGALGALDGDGTLAAVLEDGQTVVVTPRTSGPNYGGGLPGHAKYTLTHLTEHMAFTDTNRTRTTIGVGEEVDLSGMPDNTVWTGPGLLATNNAVKFIAPSNAPAGGMTATVTATVINATPLTVDFTVFPPSGVDHATTDSTYTNIYARGQGGAGIDINVWIAPTSVSFYRLEIMEVAEDATNNTGYFAYNAYPKYWTIEQLSHSTHGANGWKGPLPDYNQVIDSAASDVFDPPWVGGGGFTWNIPAKWRVRGSGQTNSMPNWSNQVLSMDANGTVTITKFGQTVTRDTNNVVTPSL